MNTLRKEDELMVHGFLDGTLDQYTRLAFVIRMSKDPKLKGYVEDIRSRRLHFLTQDPQIASTLSFLNDFDNTKQAHVIPKEEFKINTEKPPKMPNEDHNQNLGASFISLKNKYVQLAAVFTLIVSTIGGSWLIQSKDYDHEFMTPHDLIFEMPKTEKKLGQMTSPEQLSQYLNQKNYKAIITFFDQSENKYLVTREEFMYYIYALIYKRDYKKAYKVIEKFRKTSSDFKTFITKGESFQHGIFETYAKLAILNNKAKEAQLMLNAGIERAVITQSQADSIMTFQQRIKSER